MIRFCTSLLFLGLFGLSESQKKDSCPLFWSSRQNLGYGQGVQLQVCCNASAVRIWSFADISTFSNPKIAFEEKFPKPNADDIWSDLQLSVCSDRSEPTIGWVGSRPGVTCEYKKGQVLTIPSGLLDLPGWYVICYIMPGGCQTCQLDVLCENEFTDACSDKYILGSSPTATNSSIDYWIQIGKEFPFSKSASVDLEIRHQRKKTLITTKHIKAQVGSKTNVTIHGLESHEFYNVKQCLRVRLPTVLTSDDRFTFSAETIRNGSSFCLEEMFRTTRSSAGHWLSYPLLTIVLYFRIFF